MGQTTLKTINCQMCGLYFKKNNFLHVKSHRFSWLCHVCGMKLKTWGNTCNKSTKSRKCSKFHFPEFFRTRVLDTQWGQIKSPSSGLDLSKWEEDAADLGANTYENHKCSKYFWILFADNSLFNANVRMFLFLGNSNFYINSKKEDNLTSAIFYMLEACWAKPNDSSNFGWPI